MADTTIRLKALDGTWETCGVDRVPAVVPESVVLDSDDWGNKGARFDLKRDPSQVWPDIGAFTPVKIDVDGSPSWSGRVSETPSRDGADMVMSVACEGRQHELDDDLVDRFWVHNRVSEWVDTRSFLDAPLGNYKAAGTVSSDRGVFLGWPKGYVISVNDCVGVTLDLGPSRTATEAAVTLAGTTFGAGSFTVYLKGHADLATIISGGTNMASGDPASVTSLDGTSGTAYRYVSVIILCTAGGTLSVDRMVRITDAKVASDTAYLTSGASVLKASTVVGDVLDRGCPLLSTDRSGITATSLNLPAFAPGDPLTSRDAWQGVNAFHGWMSKVDVDGRPVFQAVPSRPKYQIGEWSAAEITDSSQNSGQDIYNKVIVTGTDPAGQPVRVTRSAAQTGTPAQLAQSDVVAPNPSFDTNTTGWSVGTGSITRTTTAGEFDTTPAAGKWAFAGGTGVSYKVATTTLTGTMHAGRTYLVQVRLKALVGTVSGFIVCSDTALVGASLLPVGYSYSVLSGAGFTTFSTIVAPTSDVASPVLSIAAAGSGSLEVGIDSVGVQRLMATLVDRRDFVRTKQLAVNSVLPSDGVAAAAIGDVWLNNHITTPFRGSVVLTGEDALRNRLTGQPVPLAALLRDTGELLELTDRPDPDTGATTRKGRITTVSYVPALDQATVALDSTRANLDNLLNRLAATG